ncbi:hypothetical protein E2562_025875 [Oryza meyeriana var. granulata]|uniref:Uncharacterized protein n=1 Tax=Oryza meyeriana var. granulata TaxID=110450 RepID=A0A6G1D6T8_9ORYZ|nr:hypothetical protein E2562_025875 [Oryza meyeriana var. granulata]
MPPPLCFRSGTEALPMSMVPSPWAQGTGQRGSRCRWAGPVSERKDGRCGPLLVTEVQVHALGVLPLAYTGVGGEMCLEEDAQEVVERSTCRNPVDAGGSMAVATVRRSISSWIRRQR